MAATSFSDARHEADKRDSHPAKKYNWSSSLTPSKHWADRNDEEATGDVKLFKVAEKTETFHTTAFSSGVPTTTRRQWRDKYGAPNTTATACPNLDKVMKSRLPAVAKSRDRQLAKQQALMLDAVGSIMYIMEEAVKGQLKLIVQILCIPYHCIN